MEVVIATALVAFSMVAIVGLLSPISKGVAVVIDSEVASRLATAVEQELERLGYEFVSEEVIGNAPIYFYATRDGALVRHGPPPSDETTSTDLDVNRSLFGTQPVGIAKRNRFFLVTLRECSINDQEFSAASSGAVTLSANVQWPYRVPEGPESAASVSGGDPSFDPSSLVSESERLSIVQFFSVRP